MKHIILLVVFTAIAFTCGAQSNNQRQVAEYQRQASYYHNKAARHYDQARYYQAKAARHDNEAAYYYRKGNVDRAKVEQRDAKSALWNCNLEIKAGREAENQAADYQRRANALIRKY